MRKHIWCVSYGGWHIIGTDLQLMQIAIIVGVVIERKEDSMAPRGQCQVMRKLYLLLFLVFKTNRTMIYLRGKVQKLLERGG